MLIDVCVIFSESILTFSIDHQISLIFWMPTFYGLHIILDFFDSIYV